MADQMPVLLPLQRAGGRRIRSALGDGRCARRPLRRGTRRSRSALRGTPDRTHEPGGRHTGRRAALRGELSARSGRAGKHGRKRTVPVRHAPLGRRPRAVRPVEDARHRPDADGGHARPRPAHRRLGPARGRPFRRRGRLGGGRGRPSSRSRRWRARSTGRSSRPMRPAMSIPCWRGTASVSRISATRPSATIGWRSSMRRWSRGRERRSDWNDRKLRRVADDRHRRRLAGHDRGGDSGAGPADRRSAPPSLGFPPSTATCCTSCWRTPAAATMCARRCSSSAARCTGRPGRRRRRR